MFIKYTDATGKTLLASIAPGVTPAQAAQAMGLTAWEEITATEAAELQKPEPPTLEQACTDAFERIRQARDARLNDGGMVWNGYLVSIDKEATDRMTSAAVQFIALGDLMPAVRWKMSDGEYALLDKNAFFAMSASAGGIVQQCYGAEEMKRLAVVSLPDAQAVLDWLDDPANIASGWPGDDVAGA